MTEQNLLRRELLKRSITIPLGLLLLGLRAAPSMATGSSKTCADPKMMDSAQRGMRDSLHYTEASADPARTCSGCTFFQSTGDGCGNCMIFNGPTNTNGHCDSWNGKD